MLYTLHEDEPNGESYSDLGHGKFDSAMAHFVWQTNLAGRLNADDEAINSDIGEGAARFGRRVQCWDGQGFVYLDTYSTVAEAEEAMARAHEALDEPDDDDDDDVPVNPYAGPGGLLDEFRQAERMLGDE